jgi:mRNA interferase RelE/StbE
LAWTVEISDVAEKKLKKLDRPVLERILNYFSDRIEGCKNPRHFGEPLKGTLDGLWRYRVGDYRIACEVNDPQETVLVLNIGHRRDIYKKSPTK